MKFQIQIIFLSWKVRNSNSYYIEALKYNFLFNFKNGGILKDHQQKLFKTDYINKLIKSKYDIIITSGAVSAGKFDYIPTVVKQFKTSHYFKNVQIRPGKPILFAKVKKKLFLVSQEIQYHQQLVLGFLFIHLLKIF